MASVGKKQHVFPVYRLAILVFILQYAFPSYPVYAAQEHERKSISFMHFSSGSGMPSDKIPKLISIVKSQLGMARFDSNPLPESIYESFSKRAKAYCLETMKQLQVVSNSLKQAQSALEYARKREVPFQEREILLDRKSDLIAQRQKLQEELFKQLRTVSNEVISPFLIGILSNPRLQILRAREHIDEQEHNKFIVAKAKELGITDKELRRVMDSAYFCLIIITDHDRTVIRGRQWRHVKYEISGVAIWYKFVASKRNSYIRFLKMIRSKGSSSKPLDAGFQGVTERQADELTFEEAARNLAAKFELGTIEIEDFRLKANVAEVEGGSIGFPMGMKEGLYIGQKFVVYEKQETDNVDYKKRGFFYVYKVGDNISNKEKLSYGKMIIYGAEPGMQIRESILSNYHVGLGLRYGTAKVIPSAVQESYNTTTGVFRYTVEKEIKFPVITLDTRVSYDLGSISRIPQLFLNVGSAFGNIVSKYYENTDIIISPKSGNGAYDQLQISYFELYSGIMKKYYIYRVGLYIEPSIQFQSLSIEPIGSKKDFSYSIKMGADFAAREDMALGFELAVRIPMSSDVDKGNTDISSKIRYPRLFMVIHMGLNMRRL